MDDGVAVDIIHLEAVAGGGVDQSRPGRGHPQRAAENRSLRPPALREDLPAKLERPGQGGAVKTAADCIEGQQPQVFPHPVRQVRPGKRAGKARQCLCR